ncbi:hypothetical protein EOW77_0028195 [Bradyrhizobium yuanmingense]|uniref:hypothetical protein n=1 Tax=Bradyrhizobium yuanmingense TaxID=108015 RepID=UPI000FE3F6A2|nr:hypothetical protein [Bradyrhizobium yuanmingense]TGN80504.1 hypothetical protein EOW77_0028195 [Bradyrhizobium yuanmingense]
MALPTGPGGFLEFPRYTLPEFAYIARPDSLILAPPTTTPELMGRMEDAAAAMLESLPHTPVNGLGHNFEFRDPNPDAEKLAVFTEASQDLSDESPEGWSSISTMIASSFRYANGSTIANIQRHFDGASIIIKFNFHHPLTTVQQALQVLRGENGHARMSQSFEIALNLLNNIYGVPQ